MLSKERVREISNGACEIMSQVDQQVKESKGVKRYNDLIDQEVNDYIYDNDLNEAEQKELCHQVGV